MFPEKCKCLATLISNIKMQEQQNVVLYFEDDLRNLRKNLASVMPVSNLHFLVVWEKRVYSKHLAAFQI